MKYETLDPSLISDGAELRDTAKEKKYPQQSPASRMGNHLKRGYNGLLSGKTA